MNLDDNNDINDNNKCGISKKRSYDSIDDAITRAIRIRELEREIKALKAEDIIVNEFVVLILNSQYDPSFPTIYTIPKHKLTDKDIKALNNSTPSMLADYEGTIPGYIEDVGFDNRVWTHIQFDDECDEQPTLHFANCTIVFAWRDD